MGGRRSSAQHSPNIRLSNVCYQGRRNDMPLSSERKRVRRVLGDRPRLSSKLNLRPGRTVLGVTRHQPAKALPVCRLPDGWRSRRYHINRSNLLVLESKADMQKRRQASPDDGDALALTFAQPVAPAEVEEEDEEEEFGRFTGSSNSGWMR
jgi:hypothetical protein